MGPSAASSVSFMQRPPASHPQPALAYGGQKQLAAMDSSNDGSECRAAAVRTRLASARHVSAHTALNPARLHGPIGALHAKACRVFVYHARNKLTNNP